MKMRLLKRNLQAQREGNKDRLDFKDPLNVIKIS